MSRGKFLIYCDPFRTILLLPRSQTYLKFTTVICTAILDMQNVRCLFCSDNIIFPFSHFESRRAEYSAYPGISLFFKFSSAAACELSDCLHSIYRVERGGEVTWHGPGQSIIFSCVVCIRLRSSRNVLYCFVTSFVTGHKIDLIIFFISPGCQVSQYATRYWTCTSTRRIFIGEIRLDYSYKHAVGTVTIVLFISHGICQSVVRA